MEPLHNTDEWLVFEDDGGKAAEYADFDDQVEMTAEDRAAHEELVNRVGQEYGFPMPDWTPTIPTRDRASS